MTLRDQGGIMGNPHQGRNTQLPLKALLSLTLNEMLFLRHQLLS